MSATAAELRAKAREAREQADREKEYADKAWTAADELVPALDVLTAERALLQNHPEAEAGYRYVEVVHNAAWMDQQNFARQAQGHEANVDMHMSHAAQYTAAAELLDPTVEEEPPEPQEPKEDLDEAPVDTAPWRFEVTDAAMVVRFPLRATGWVSVNQGDQYAVNPGEELELVPGQTLELFDGRGQLRASTEVPNG